MVKKLIKKYLLHFGLVSLSVNSARLIYQPKSNKKLLKYKSRSTPKAN